MANMSGVLSEELKNKNTAIASQINSLSGELSEELKNKSTAIASQINSLNTQDGRFQTKITAAERKLATLPGTF